MTPMAYPSDPERARSTAGTGHDRLLARDELARRRPLRPRLRVRQDLAQADVDDDLLQARTCSGCSLLEVLLRAGRPRSVALPQLPAHDCTSSGSPRSGVQARRAAGVGVPVGVRASGRSQLAAHRRHAARRAAAGVGSRMPPGSTSAWSPAHPAVRVGAGSVCLRATMTPSTTTSTPPLAEAGGSRSDRTTADGSRRITCSTFPACRVAAGQHDHRSDPCGSRHLRASARSTGWPSQHPPAQGHDLHAQLQPPSSRATSRRYGCRAGWPWSVDEHGASRRSRS